MSHSILLFDCNKHCDAYLLVPTNGWPMKCVETMMQAVYPEGRVLAEIRDATWYTNGFYVWEEHVQMYKFATSPSWEARLRKGDWDEFQEECALEAEREAAKALDAFVKLPTDFVDFAVANWEKLHRAFPNWVDGKPRVDEEERLAIIKAAVAVRRKS